MSQYADYKILEARNAKDLEREVMKYLELGYQLAGGHQVTTIGYADRVNARDALSRIVPSGWNITQAVYKLPVKEEKREKKII
jgi:hypothetical protein